MNDKIGILDPEGNNINPLNNKPFSDNYKILAKKWSVLPTYKKSKEILKHISKKNILLIQSGTGFWKISHCAKIIIALF